MTITARLVSAGASVVVKTAPNGGLQPTSSGVTLKNTILTDSAQNKRLDALVDVIADDGTTAAGSTLVYDPTTDKYVVKLLDLDGGSF